MSSYKILGNPLRRQWTVKTVVTITTVCCNIVIKCCNIYKIELDKVEWMAMLLMLSLYVEGTLDLQNRISRIARNFWHEWRKLFIRFEGNCVNVNG